MKKHYLVAIIGTLALVANLLVPGLAFGQSQQGGTEQVNCPDPGDVSITTAPESVTFQPTPSPTSGTASTYDPNLPTQSTHRSIHLSNMLEITDNISKGIYGCPGKAWYIYVKIISMDGSSTTYGLISETKDTDVIPASSIIFVLPDYYTLADDTIPDGDCTLESLDSVGIWACDLSTSRHAFLSWSIPLVPPSTEENYQTSLPFDHAPNTKTLNNEVYVMRHLCPGSGNLGEENSRFYAGAAMYIKDGIAQFQPSGKYVGTIEYTLDPGADCT